MLKIIKNKERLAKRGKIVYNEYSWSMTQTVSFKEEAENEKGNGV